MTDERKMTLGNRPMWLVALLAVLWCSPATAATYYLAPTGADANPGTQGQPWRTLQKAADTMVAGDIALVGDGDYAGFTQRKDGTQAAPITFRAASGGAVVRGDQTVLQDAIFVTEADWVTIEGLTVRQARRAGIRISLSNHVTVRNCRCLDNPKWGIFTDYSDDTVLEWNECAGSTAQHGIYDSNGGDRTVIRGNILHDNGQCGLQINADPPAAIRPSLGTRGDGITDGALVERNVIYSNGRLGGAAINLASVRNSRIVNNLMYHNLAGGIVCWDTNAGLQFGSKNNVIAHNTVYFRPTEGRWALQLINGSTGCTVYDNVLIGGRRGALEVDRDTPVLSDYNVLRRASAGGAITNQDTGAEMSLAQWQAASGNDLHSLAADPGFVMVGSDFRLAPASPLIDKGMTLADVRDDLEGHARPSGATSDIGCYEFASATPPPTPLPPPVDNWLEQLEALLQQALDLLRSHLP